MIWRRLAQDLPRDRDLDCPTIVSITWPIDRAADVDAHPETGDVPCVNGRTAIAVRLREEQVPGGAECIHFEFVVRVRVAVRIDEDLEVIVLEDD